MRTSAGILVLVLAQGLAGCDSHSSVLPTAPTFTPSPAAPPPVAGERWNLTTTLRSATATNGCVLDTSLNYLQVGSSSESLMTIERSGESIHLVVDPTDDRLEYDGSVVADVLTVIKSEHGFTSSGWCGEKGGRVEFRGEIYISGRFSGDGHALTAEEVVTSQLNSGETLSFHYDWSATRQ